MIFYDNNFNDIMLLLLYHISETSYETLMKGKY